MVALAAAAYLFLGIVIVTAMDDDPSPFSLIVMAVWPVLIPVALGLWIKDKLR